MKKIILLCIFFLPLIVFSQVSDDFEDGNINGWTENIIGHWAASSENPITGTYSLKHNLADVEDFSYITHVINNITIDNGETVWMFNFKNGNWNPSGSNYFGVYLFSDNEDLSSDLNGYVVGVNMTGTGDALSLWEVSSGSFNAIIETIYIWPSAATLGIKVTRSAIGEWTLEYDEDGGFDNLIFGGSAMDNTHSDAFYTGAFFEYTSTRAGEFWLDDFSLTGPADSEPPQILTVEAVSNNTLIVDFNEDLEESSAENINFYFVDNAIGNPATSTLNPTDNKQVELVFSSTFTDEQIYSLSVNGVEDLNGNTCSGEFGNFSYTHIAVTGASPVSSTELDVFFNKNVDLTSAETLLNYSVNSSIGNPIVASVDGTDQSIVHLSFADNFNLEQLYTLTVQNIEDEYGNIIITVNIDFSYYAVQPYDIIINEIMCDVNPAPAFLPVHEYIEIYNNSNYDVNLTGWTMQIGTSIERTFPSVLVPSGEYAIICEDIAETEFSTFGITIPFLTPSELTVSGKRIVIKNDQGIIIEDLTYSDEWYDDDAKDGGGFSLERIDPLNFCGEDENWTATIDDDGGTPGRENSVYSVNPDISAPTVLEIEYVSSKQINIHFSENVNQIIAEDVNNYLLNSTVNPTTAITDTENGSIISLFFDNNFNIGDNQIQIENIEDNCNNIMQSYTENFSYQLINPVSVNVVSENQIRVYFSEKVDLMTAQDPNNYFVNEGIGNPIAALINNSDSTIIGLLFENDFTLEQIYNLTVENIEDVNQNVMEQAVIDFVYYIPKPFDIVFTEIMADINPEPVGLPAERYIEIYNTSSFEINLQDWIFSAEGQTEKVFPFLRIEPDAYVILCEEDAEDLFTSYAVTAPILSSSDITVSGRNLKILKSDETIIDEVTYSDEWYDNTDYDDGGWSLEKIDPENFCGENDNWTVSIDNRGGSPGEINSVDNQNPDNAPPELMEAKIISSNYLILEFDENISYESGETVSNFSVNNDINNPNLSYTDGSNRKIVHLLFTEEFQDEQDYTLMIDNIQDNCDNTLQTTGYDFSYLRIYPKELWVKDEKNLKIKFSETVDLQTGVNVLNYTCDNNIGNPRFVFRETSDTTSIHLEFENEFPNGEEITINIQNVEDINGNIMHSSDISFIYYTPKRNDLVINEILFNPFKGGNDFVEIYNRSEYEIDLSKISLASRNDTLAITSVSPLFETNYKILPETYMVFTTKRDSVLRDYMSLNEENIIEINAMPSFSDSEGTVLLVHKNDSIIDEFNYNEDMHFKLLDDVEGVSLERVNFDKETQDPSNWHSASEYVNFATPAYQNSQYAEPGEPRTEPVYVEPYVFSPDNDGYDDYANINYQFSNPGNVATVLIFDAKGRMVNELANNMSLSLKGTFVWDGLDSENRIAPAGTYLVYFKVFNLDGTVELYKVTTVLAKRI